METLEFLAYKLAFPLGVVALFHFVLNKYPDPLPRDENSKKGIRESILICVIFAVFLLGVVFSPLLEGMANPTPLTLITFIAIMALPYIVIPVLYIRSKYKWSLRDYGFRMPLPNTKAIIIFAIIFFVITGLKPLLEDDFTPMPVMMIVFSLYQPAFIEEFLFRGILQGRLERAVGQNKSWIYAGLLFGLVHLPVNYLVANMDFATGLVQFMSQTAWGWVFGILYMKTRSLYPGMLVHFVTNGIMASLVGTVISLFN